MKFNVELKKNIDNSYPIVIENGALSKASEHIQQATKAKKLLVVTNDTVLKLYNDKLLEQLKDFDVTTVSLPDGEEYKNIESLQRIWNTATQIRLERSDCIIALGGGVIGDMAGFAASTYLRGIDFIQVPTTLLAQVDSSVGGKVAINHKEGKNLLGAFYQPKLVIIDTSTLKTLPERELKTGLSEVVKYAFIEKTCDFSEDFELIKFLDNNKSKIYNLEKEVMENLATYCCKLKASVVSQDEKETGLRAILNLGHTIGHAIEKVTNYNTYKHGEAVAMGIIGAFKLALDKNLITQEYFENSLMLLKKLELKYSLPEDISTKEIVDALNYDKKIQQGKIRFILPKGKSTVAIFDDVSAEQIFTTIEFIRTFK